VNLVLNGIQAMVAVGLSICRSIIEAHGGEIWANPNPDGPGGTFSFGLPAVERSAVTQS
jgi:two-component system sensor histidine kinase TtrS